jgi:hypothetical protein
MGIDSLFGASTKLCRLGPFNGHLMAFTLMNPISPSKVMNLTFSDKPRPDQTSSGVALPLNPLTFASTQIAQKLAVQQLQTDAQFLPVSAPAHSISRTPASRASYEEIP